MREGEKMKSVILIMALLALSGCAPSGNGEAYFCPATPAALLTMNVGDSITSPALADLFSGVTPQLTPTTATYHFSRYNATYDQWCWDRIAVVDRATETISSVTVAK